MYVEYSESSGEYEVRFSDEDRCRFCLYVEKCPLIASLAGGGYCISKYHNIPTEEFCDLFEINEEIKNLNKKLYRRGRKKKSNG